MRKAYAGAKIADLGQTGVWDHNCQHFFKVSIHSDWRYFGLPNLISLVLHLGVHFGIILGARGSCLIFLLLPRRCKILENRGRARSGPSILVKLQ